MITRLFPGLTLFVCIFFFTAGHSVGQELKKITVYGKEIPHFLDHTPDSPFVKFLGQMERHSGVEFIVSIMPAKRATVLFEQGEADALIPFPMVREVSRSFDEFQSVPLTSLPIALLTRHVLTLQSNPKIHSLDDLKGLSVGLSFGYEYSKELLEYPYVSFDYAPDQVSLVRKLYTGRTNAIVSFPFEAELLFKKLEFEQLPHYDREFILETSDIVMLTHDDIRGQQVRNIINTSIQQMEQTGELKQLSLSFIK